MPRCFLDKIGYTRYVFSRPGKFGVGFLLPLRLDKIGHKSVQKRVCMVDKVEHFRNLEDITKHTRCFVDKIGHTVDTVPLFEHFRSLVNHMCNKKKGWRYQESRTHGAEQKKKKHR